MLTLKNLTKRFQSIPAVQDLWLEIERGEILSLLGPSGCGKSTTLQMVAGVLRPTTGAIELDNVILNNIPPEKRDIALVLQRGLLFPHLTVGENVAFGLKMRGINRAEREERAIAILQQVHLHGFEQRKPSELSGGQAQRVALARSLIIQPKLLLLDEPLSALDANLREEMQDLILQLQRQTGVTLLIVTHDQSEAVVMSHRIALMFDGRLHQVATPETLYRQPASEAIARFMGGVNFLAATAHGYRWTLPNGQVLTSGSPQTGSLTLTIRPEQIQILTEPVCGSNILAATVLANRFTGTQRRLTVELDSELSLQAWTSPAYDFAVGESIWIHLPPDSLWGFPQQGLPTRAIADVPIRV